METTKPIYWLSDIYYDEPKIKVKIVDLESGYDFIIYLAEREKLRGMFNYFKDSKDIHTLGYLEAMDTLS